MEHSTGNWVVGAPIRTAASAGQGRFQVGDALRTIGIIPGVIAVVGLSFLLKLPGALINRVFSAEYLLQHAPDLATIADPLYQTIVGLILIFIALVLSAANVRRALAKNSKTWSTTCPCCGEPELARRKRRLSHRFSGMLLQLPLRRYGCNSCTWSGLRIDRSLL